LQAQRNASGAGPGRPQGKKRGWLVGSKDEVSRKGGSIGHHRHQDLTEWAADYSHVPNKAYLVGFLAWDYECPTLSRASAGRILNPQRQPLRPTQHSKYIILM
jgi:hypothetical protein